MTVYIIDDDASVRDSLSLLLSLKGHQTATFSCAEDFLSAAQPHWRGCAIVDIRMPGISGLDLQSRIVEALPLISVVVISAHADVRTVRQAFLGEAVDFLEKPFSAESLLEAIAKALDRSSRQAVPAQASSAQQALVARLTDREREIVALLTRGHHNKAVAERLGISPRTVEVHRARAMAKLGARNLVDLVRLADAAPLDGDGLGPSRQGQSTR